MPDEVVARIESFEGLVTEIDKRQGFAGISPLLKNVNLERPGALSCRPGLERILTGASGPIRSMAAWNPGSGTMLVWASDDDLQASALP